VGERGELWLGGVEDVLNYLSLAATASSPALDRTAGMAFPLQPLLDLAHRSRMTSSLLDLWRRERRISDLICGVWKRRRSQIQYYDDTYIYTIKEKFGL
jgi:hypothetical protein